jgi:hypothetical protein
MLVGVGLMLDLFIVGGGGVKGGGGGGVAACFVGGGEVLRGGMGMGRIRLAAPLTRTGFFLLGLLAAALLCSARCAAACCAIARQVLSIITRSNANCCSAVVNSNSLTLSPFLLFSNEIEDSVLK